MPRKSTKKTKTKYKKIKGSRKLNKKQHRGSKHGSESEAMMAMLASDSDVNKSNRNHSSMQHNMDNMYTNQQISNQYQMPGMNMQQMPGMNMQQMPGMNMQQMPGMNMQQMPGMNMQQMPGMNMQQMPGIDMSQMANQYNMPGMNVPGMNVPGMDMAQMMGRNNTDALLASEIAPIQHNFQMPPNVMTNKQYGQTLNANILDKANKFGNNIII